MKFPTLYILVDSFLDPKSGRRIIGGTETWTAALIDLAGKHGSRSVVLQRCPEADAATLKPDSADYDLIGWKDVAQARMKLRELRRKQPGVLILYGNHFTPSADERPAVFIHHGIGSDGCCDPAARSLPARFAADLKRRWNWWKENTSLLAFYRGFSRIVCVDTNCINQFRSAWPMYDPGEALTYVPNWGDLLDPELIERKWESVREKPVVIFARRFRYVRGAWLWAGVLEKIAPEYPHAEFHCVGHGEGEARLREVGSRYSNIKIYSKPFSEMAELYRIAHISVVPSLWSEGTSLSAIEAMAAGCAVISSNVGGLGNIVIDGANGRLVAPTQEAVSRALKQCLDDLDAGKKLALRAYESAGYGFSRELWEQRMAELLCSIPEDGRGVDCAIVRRVR